MERNLKKLVEEQKEKEKQEPEVQKNALYKDFIKAEYERFHTFGTLDKTIQWPEGVRKRWFN